MALDYSYYSHDCYLDFVDSQGSVDFRRLGSVMVKTAAICNGAYCNFCIEENL